MMPRAAGEFWVMAKREEAVGLVHSEARPPGDNRWVLELQQVGGDPRNPVHLTVSADFAYHTPVGARLRFVLEIEALPT